VDTYSVVTENHAKWLKASGYDFVVRYLGNLSIGERDVILGAGLGLGLVTFAKEWNGLLAIQHLSRLDMPQGTTVFLDVEDVEMNSLTLIGAITAWTRPIVNGGFDPGVYLGAKCLLTSEEMFALPVRKYWHSCSRVVDRNGKEAGPQCGWVMRQLFPPNVNLPCGLRVDFDVVENDYSDRKVSMVVA
jgi:hypothetical protein